MTYFGRGPWENYQDRNTAAFIDLYKSKVKDQYVPYIMPQENACKTDVRWVALIDKNNNGLLIISSRINKNMGISALHMTNATFDITDGLDYGDNQLIEKKYQMKENPVLNYSKHTNDIQEQNLVQLNIYLVQRGVGGDDS